MPRQDDPNAADRTTPAYARQARGQRVAGRMPPVVRVSTPQHGLAATTYTQQQRSAVDALLQNDKLFLWINLLLCAACIITLSVWLVRIANGQVDASRLIILLVVILIYVLCAGAGWMSGRYQSSPEQEELQQQLSNAQQEIGNLQQTNYELQQTLQRMKTSVEAPKQAQIPQRVSLPPTDPSASRSIYEQQREPDDSRDLPFHPHEKLFPTKHEPNQLDYGWRLIAASRRGYGHGYEGKYREDDFQVLFFPAHNSTLALVAISDGVSSKEFSRRGALAAVQGATVLTEQLANLCQTLLTHTKRPDEMHTVAGKILLLSLRNAYTSIVQAAAHSRLSTEDLQCTLLVFVAVALSPDQLYLARVQIGDGAMFGLCQSEQTPEGNWQQLLAPQIQAAGNEVYPFTQSNEKDWQRYIQCDILQSFTCIMSMTDGIADDIEPPMPSPSNPHPDQFTMVEKFHKAFVVPALQSSQPADELLKLTGYHKKQSYDDRTLVYLYR